MSEDNPLANVDLRAVTALRAPSGFADGVLARFTSTEAAIAVEKRRRVRRFAWIASGALAVVAAVLALVWLWPHGKESGSYIAGEPHHVDLAGLAVDLEGGAAIAWHVDHGDLHVDQRGGATWTVPPGQHLHVEVAGVGAVDASSAILHVEAQMNLMDKKTIGATAATAVLVTAVAATVLHGRATVSGAGQELTIKEGESASVAPGKAPVEVLTAGDPTALEIVFSGEQRWTDQQLETMETAIDHLQLPLGSTVGAVSYSTGAQLRAEATPASRFGAGWLGYTSLYRGAKGSDLVQGVTMGLAELRKSQLAHKVLVIVGDGNDTNNDAAKGALLELQDRARHMGVTIRAVLAPPFTTTPSVVEAAGIPAVDASKIEITHALADAMGGAVQPPVAVVVLYEARGLWASADVLAALGRGMEELDLPPDSRMAVIEYSTGAEIRVPFEPVKDFKSAQLGSAKAHAAKRGSDLIQGIAMGLAELAKAREPDKVLVVIGDGHDTN
ncbi:MAG TPA: VWA domain-containing protein, partial [Kofleriaceae bacterium]|nr:VWA domain-containing protein [Kofleriaceae bacterium]